MEQVYIFGRGVRFQKYEEEIARQYKIIGFLDNAIKEKEFVEKYSCYAYNPNAIHINNNETIIICIKNFIEIVNQISILYPNANVLIKSEDENIIVQSGQLFYCYDDFKVHFINYEELNTIRVEMARENSEIKGFLALNHIPKDPGFGRKYGLPVDRVYIERFLLENKEYIKGRVLEVADNNYTIQFGQKNVIQSDISHIFGWNNTLKINIETGEGVVENIYDCYICTQVLQYIYDLKTAMANIYKMLKPNGVALITVPGIKSLSASDDANWGEKWSFTKKSLELLCAEVTSEDNFVVKTFGNVKVCMAYLYGLSTDFLSEEEINYNDSKYPFLITAKIVKR